MEEHAASRGDVGEGERTVCADASGTRAANFAAGLAGVVAGGVGLSLGSLVAVYLRQPTPVNAVGDVVIAHAPVGVREFAIRTFGHHDKQALQFGIAVLVAAAAYALGRSALHRVWPLLVGIAAFTLAGVLSAVSRPAAGVSALWGPLLAGCSTLGAVWFLLRAATPGVGAEPGARAVETVAPAVVAASAEEATARTVVRRVPGRSVASAGFERRRFVTATAAAVGVAGFAQLLARRRRGADLAGVEHSAPAHLPDARALDDRVATEAAHLDPAVPYITPVGDFYRVDTALEYPRIRTGDWQLAIHGLVERPVTLTYDDILRLPQVTRTITLTCVSNEVGGDLVGNAQWQGVLLRDLLAKAVPLTTAEQVATTSADGFTAGFPISYATDPGRDALLAIAMNGRPLPVPHGFPARLVVPGLYGYVSATKWIVDLAITTWDDFDGFWVGEGWAKRAPIKTQSRIDVPKGDVDAGTVTVAGVAWAQHSGIARVEVRVDDGEWHDATLGQVANDDTWCQWRWEWRDARPGKHRLTVRATDKRGSTQTEVVGGPPPDGATGWHSRNITVRG